MANTKLTISFLAISAFDVDNVNPEFPKENAVNMVSPQRAFRSANATDTRLVIDLGAVQTSLTCYLDWVNFGSFKYQESADGSTGWADIGVSRTVEKDPMHGVYRRKDDITLTGKRYLGIFIPTQAPVDGAAYFRIGTFAIPTNVVELNVETTVEWPFEVNLPESNIIENKFLTGKTEKIKLGALDPMTISFGLRSTVEQNIAGAVVSEIGDLLRDSTKIIYIDLNFGESWQAYLVKKVAVLRATINDPAVSTLDMGTILMEVVT